MRKMLSTFAVAGALALSAVAATPAAAIEFTGSWDVDHYDSDYLGLNIETSAESGNLNFHLTDVFPGDAEYILPLFTLWADDNYGSWGDADWIPQDITIDFNFTSPTTNGDVSGITVGALDWGTLIWTGGHTSFNFGDTGVMHVLVYNDNALGVFGPGQNKAVGVNAKFWLESMPSAVPEPATWAMMITGFGLAGVALRRRRSLGAVAA